jgi:hypothetical protein
MYSLKLPFYDENIDIISTNSMLLTSLNNSDMNEVRTNFN